MADTKDNIWVTPGKKDETKVYIGTPVVYRSAKAALKEAGAVWKGSNWEMDKDAFAAAEDKIREAAREDIALGTEGRKAREAEIKAAQPEKAPKKELTEEEKAARAEAGRARAIERDATRTPVIEGSVAAGDDIGDNKVDSLGAVWTLDEEGAAALNERFPDVEGLVVGANVQFANFAQPEAEADAPGM